jgi:hypothetical protein
MTKSLNIIRLFLFVALVIAGFYHILSKYDKNEYHIICCQLTHQNNNPVGELISTFSIRQNISNFKEHLDSHEFDSFDNEKICLSLLMANYGDRANKGSFRVGLESYQKKEFVDVKVVSVNDNKYQTVCFETITLKDIKTLDFAIVLKGVDGLPGTSVTAWSTQDISSGNIDESPHRSLMFKISVLSIENTKNIASMIFIFFTGIAIFLLALPLFKRF